MVHGIPHRTLPDRLTDDTNHSRIQRATARYVFAHADRIQRTLGSAVPVASRRPRPALHGQQTRDTAKNGVLPMERSRCARRVAIFVSKALMQLLQRRRFLLYHRLDP